ncbi:RNA-directed DNA polymerase from mobile element jockey, partial [Stegodyphus mimosarum]
MLGSANVIDFFLLNGINYDYTVETLNELSSDHNPVVLKLNHNICSTPQPTAFKTNWCKYTKALNNTQYTPITVQNEEELDAQIEKFTSDLQTALKNNSEACKKKRRQTTELQNLIKVRNKARKEWQRTRNRDDKKIPNALHQQVRTLSKK